MIKKRIIGIWTALSKLVRWIVQFVRISTIGSELFFIQTILWTFFMYSSRFGANQHHFWSISFVRFFCSFVRPSFICFHLNFWGFEFLIFMMPFFFLWLMIRYYFTPQSSKCHRNDMLTRKHCTPIQILFIKINRVVLLSQWNWLHIQNTLTEHEQKRIAPVL